MVPKGLAQGLAFFIVEVTLFNAVPEALERARLVRVGAVDENSWVFSFEGEAEVHVRAESVRDIYETELIQLIVDFWKGVLKHVLLTLKDS